MQFLGKVRSAVAGALTAFGWGGRAYSETTDWSSDRSQIMFYLPEDSRQYVTSYTRQELLKKAEWLYQNFGIVKKAMRGIARHTVGVGISPQADTDDLEWNELAEADFEDWAISAHSFDVAGRRNFYEWQTWMIEQRIWRGEAFSAFADGRKIGKTEPVMMQMFECADVRTPDNQRENKSIIDGVEVDQWSSAVRYWVRQRGGQFAPVDAAEMIHFYKAERTLQLRGITELAQAANRLVDIHDLIKLTTKSAKLQAALAVMVKRGAKMNGQGAIGRIREGGTVTNSDNSEDTSALETVFGGGAIAYVGENGDVKLVNSSSPSPLVKEYVSDLLMRDVCASWEVDPEFFWSVGNLGGTSQRAILSLNDLFFQILGDELIYRALRQVWFRRTQARMTAGKLRPCKDKDWARKLSWQTPARITVDNGRDGKLELEQLNNGADTLRGIYNRRGKNWRHETRQWIREWVAFFQMCDEEKAPEAVRGMWRAGKPGAQGANPQGNPDEMSALISRLNAASDADMPAILCQLEAARNRLLTLSN